MEEDLVSSAKYIENEILSTQTVAAAAGKLGREPSTKAANSCSAGQL